MTNVNETIYILTRKKMFELLNNAVQFIGNRIKDYTDSGKQLTQSVIEIFIEEYVNECTKYMDRDGRKIEDTDLKKDGYFGSL